jgi:trypsin
MSRTKLVVTVAMVAVMLAAGSAAFAAPQPPDQPQPGQQQQPSPGPGIVGGSNVPDSNKYPFVAALLDTRKPGSTFDQFTCGGSLIDSDSVLTAAHCVHSIFPRNLSVVVGRAQLSTNEGQLREATRIYIPDGYNYTRVSKNDVAVIKLRSAVTGITPVRIPLSTENGYEQAGKLQTVAGWGSMTAGGSYPDQMQEVKVPVVSDAEGEKVFGSQFVPELMIAAGDASRSHCKGDSGGPLFTSFPRFGKAPVGGSAPLPPRPSYQYGIASFAKLSGKQCGVDPAAFTEVNAPSIREFITTSMNK